jgi:hypothetical protein
MVHLPHPGEQLRPHPVALSQDDAVQHPKKGRIQAVADLPDHALTTRLLEIRTQERSLLVELLGLLVELDRRRTVLALGFSSLFSFCTDRLGLTKASAFRRTSRPAAEAAKSAE